MKNTLSIFALLLSCFVFSASSLAEETSKEISISNETFNCIREMTPVRGFFVDNLMDDLDATVAVANSPDGGVYPPGSVVQLVPGEVMVKHPQGFSPATKDWEFFELDVSPEGSAIRKRGFADVVNRFGGNCFACHAQAKPQWDMICETGHGCEPIPLTRDILVLLQNTDPRCANNEALTAEEIGKLTALRQAMQPKD
jgi:hypothetical protein